MRLARAARTDDGDQPLPRVGEHGGEGHVFVHSERWNATGPDALEKGATVTVEGISGLQLEVSLPGESVD